MRFGVPDAKLEKWIIDRRVAHPRGRRAIEFVYDVDVGPRRRPPSELRDRYDALVVVDRLARVSATSTVPGRELEGIHLAMDYLYQRNRWVAAAAGPAAPRARAGHRDHRRGQARDRDRRRRHRDGLHLELQPRGRAQRAHARRLRRRSPPTAPTRAPLAAAAQADAHDVRARRGRQAPLGNRGDRLRRDRRHGQSRVRPPGHRHLVARPDAGPRQRVRAGRRPRADRDRLQHPEHDGLVERARARARPPRQHQDDADLPHLHRRRVRVRRRPASASR